VTDKDVAVLAEIKDCNPIADSDAVVTVSSGPVGAHVGILYLADDEGNCCHLHLAWHYVLENVPNPPNDSFWVEPEVDSYALSDVGASARLIAKRYEDGRIPYAFRPTGAMFAEDGTLQLHGSRGLTCATFVLRVFDHAQATLIDEQTWDIRSAKRREQDERVQKKLVDYLSRDPKSREHAKLVAEEIGCTRFRAEEVAAASGLQRHPIAFVRAEKAGRLVLEALDSVGT
jgi:hypothetical protein